MKDFYRLLTVSTVAAALSVASAHASSLASDNAAAAVYSGGGNFNGLNGGIGFGAWTNTPTANSGVAGSFVATSTANAGGSLGIDTSGVSWGFYGNSGNTG